jgi:hypothetical protein
LNIQKWSWSIVGAIVTRLRTGSIPGSDKGFITSAELSYRLVVHLASNRIYTGGSFLRRKTAGRDVEYSLPSVAEVKIKWSYTSTPIIPSWLG